MLYDVTDKLDDLQCGKAGEYLVCAKLILEGYIAFPSEQGLPYDVVVEHKQKLYRVQVKTTRTARQVPQRIGAQPAYLFAVKLRGKKHKQLYTDGMVDLFAFVALDTFEVGFLPAKDCKRSLIFRSSLYKGQYRDERDKARALKIKELKEAGETYESIANEVGIKVESVKNVLTNPVKAYKYGKYLCDFPFSSAITQTKSVICEQSTMGTASKSSQLSHNTLSIAV